MARKRKLTKRAYKKLYTPKRPGYATRAAAREGLTVNNWARKHYHDGGPRGSVSLRRGQAARYYWHVLTHHHSAP